MKKKYNKPIIYMEELQVGPICAACETTLTNQSDLNNCGYEMADPFGGQPIYLFPQGAGGCTCWNEAGFDMYCYQPSYSTLFGS